MNPFFFDAEMPRPPFGDGTRRKIVGPMRPPREDSR